MKAQALSGTVQRIVGEEQGTTRGPGVDVQEARHRQRAHGELHHQRAGAAPLAPQHRELKHTDHDGDYRRVERPNRRHAADPQADQGRGAQHGAPAWRRGPRRERCQRQRRQRECADVVHLARPHDEDERRQREEERARPPRPFAEGGRREPVQRAGREGGEDRIHEPGGVQRRTHREQRGTTDRIHRIPAPGPIQHPGDGKELRVWLARREETACEEDVGVKALRHLIL